MRQLIFKQYPVSLLLYPMLVYAAGFFAPISSKAHNNIFYILVLVPFILWVNKRDCADLFRSRIVLLTVIFSAYLVLRSVFYLPLEFSECTDPLRHLVAFLIFFAILVRLFQLDAFERKLSNVALWAAVWGAGTAILYYSQNRFFYRLPFNGPSDHAIIGACVYAVMALLVLFSPRSYPRTVAVMAFIALFAAVLLAQSRGPLLSLTVAVIAGILCTHRKWLVVLPVAFWGAFLVANHQGWSVFGRLFKVNSSYRFQIWQQVFERSWHHGDWLFGQSLLADQTVQVGKFTFDHAHSGYVSTFFHGGLVGLLLLIVLLVVAGWCAVKVLQQERCALVLSLYVFSVLIIATDTHKMLDGPGAVWFYFWLPLAYIAASELSLEQD